MQSKILFRCSRLGALFTEPKTKSAKDAGELAETTKTLIREMWLRNEFGYDEKVVTDEMLKGLLAEQDSIELWQQVSGSKLLLKNTETKSNDYIIGTADIDNGNYVDDLKTCWSLRTFIDAEPSKDNEHQIKGYCWLYGKKKGRVVFTLVPTPEELITEQEKRFYYKFNCDTENKHYQEISQQIRHNNDLILKIAPEKRVKIFEYTFDDTYKLDLMARIEKARIYYNNLKL